MGLDLMKILEIFRMSEWAYMLLWMNGGGGEGSDYGSSDEGSYEYDEEGEEDYEEELELSLVSAIVSTYDSLPQPQLNSQFRRTVEVEHEDDHEAWQEVDIRKNRGLSADTLASLPSVTYKLQHVQDGNTEQCVICRVELEEGESLCDVLWTTITHNITAN
ncbi:hypothetical protein ACJX0J_017907, partial [Zea mays]